MHPFLVKGDSMEKIKVGVIVNTHGLKGEVKVKSFSDFNKERFAKGKKLFIEEANTFIEVKVHTYREHNGMVLISFENREDINLIEKYCRCDLYVSKADLHELEANEVYFYELMNCEVYDEEGNQVGVVEDVFDTGANAVLRVNQKILIPYVDAFIKEVDTANKKIIIHMMEGLV